MFQSARLGRAVTVCCSWHREPVCCDPNDCGPCCEKCPTCPTLNRDRMWRGVRGGVTTVKRDGMVFKAIVIEVPTADERHVVRARVELDRTPGQFRHRTRKALDRMVRSLDEQIHA